MTRRQRFDRALMISHYRSIVPYLASFKRHNEILVENRNFLVPYPTYRPIFCAPQLSVAPSKFHSRVSFREAE